MAGALGPARLVAAVLAAALAVASAIVPLWSGLGPPVLLVRSVSGVVFVAAGVVVWARDAPGRLGWRFLLAGSAMCLINVTLGPGPVLTTLRVLSGGYALFGITLVHLLLSYPGGRVPRGFDRALVAYGYLITGCYLAAQYLIGDASGQRFCAPVGCDAIGPAPIASDRAAAAVPVFVLVAFSVAVVLLVVALVRHWRAATPRGRRELRPVLLSLAATCGLAITSGAVRLLVLDGEGAVRVSIAVVWGVTVSAVAISLLVGALRNRLVLYGMGPLVDQLGADHPASELQTVLARLLRDPTVQLLRAEPDGTGFLDLNGVHVVPGGPGRVWLPIGEPPAGAISYDSHASPDPRVVQAVTGALRLLLDNLRLQDRLREQLIEVDASRARILQASDEERRRVERDLHDGAQQHLVTSTLTVRQARSQLRHAPDAADLLLAGVETQLRTALREIRDLARGLLPAILSEEGIGAAVDSLAARLPLRTEVHDALPRRYPFVLETTSYFVVCEALVNVVKYAEVDEALVRLTERDGTVLVEVDDRGRGGAEPDHGSGLRGLADRVGAVGGLLEVSSPPGAATTVRASLPVVRREGELSGPVPLP